MCQIIIIDDNQTTGIFLKKALEREAHQVMLVAYEEDAIIRFKRNKTALVMINQTCRQYSGWKIFNQVKLFYPEMPLMLCLLNSIGPADTLGVVKAVEEVLRHRSRAPVTGEQTLSGHGSKVFG